MLLRGYSNLDLDVAKRQNRQHSFCQNNNQRNVLAANFQGYNTTDNKFIDWNVNAAFVTTEVDAFSTSFE